MSRANEHDSDKNEENKELNKDHGGTQDCKERQTKESIQKRRKILKIKENDKDKT